ncbi:hypothetical protein X766_15900 [Mesorhizobium sp. LSJC255A00]|uniref:hypothetical protein n=1 Tax=Mesorhizobium sp. LSJC255A00 TaxID=1287313 RepID=UPI0003CF68CF|nr:hypothetical protein [Mesorhizobium sp. LSJC255A00]ESX17879.1 hypothetical protein X766_15900 [Mesorhizobium sp. LSJC255A00]
METALAILWRVLKICIPVPVLAILILLAWWQLDKSSSVRLAVDKAVDGYTHVTELAAANARIYELERQKDAADKAADWLTHQIEALNRKQVADDNINEKKDITYAQALKDAGRGCTLNDADIDGMRDE